MPGSLEPQNPTAREPTDSKNLRSQTPWSHRTVELENFPNLLPLRWPPALAPVAGGHQGRGFGPNQSRPPPMLSVLWNACHRLFRLRLGRPNSRPWRFPRWYTLPSLGDGVCHSRFERYVPKECHANPSRPSGQASASQSAISPRMAISMQRRWRRSSCAHGWSNSASSSRRRKPECPCEALLNRCPQCGLLCTATISFVTEYRNCRAHDFCQFKFSSLPFSELVSLCWRGPKSRSRLDEV